MVFYAHLLQSALDSPTIVVMTDRIDLDDQLYSQFSRCAAFLRQTPVQAESKVHLKSLLDGREANGIIFTTMFKFEAGEQPLSTRRNIVVMADEAHRGQYGFDERIVMGENEAGEQEARVVVGNARIIHDALPNATFIGFTGTPVSMKDRNTREVFGDYIDVYDMTQAVEDGATRPVYYESRVVHLKLDEDTLKKIDETYDLLEQQADQQTIEKSKKMLGQMESVLGADSTIQSLCEDIVTHYETNRAQLLDQLRRRGISACLIFRINRMPERRAMFIKTDRHILDVLFLNHFQQHIQKTVNGIGIDAVRVHQRQCVKRPVHQAVSVHNQK